MSSIPPGALKPSFPLLVSLKLPALAFLLSTMLLLGTCVRNRPPTSPGRPVGPSAGRADSSYTFVVTATDPDNDDVIYRFDWGDGDTSHWSTIYSFSGNPDSMSHSWADPGRYFVRAQARDEKGATSAWSEAHEFGVNAPAPPVFLSWPDYGLVDTAYDFIVYSSDPDDDSVCFRFAWGNGDTSDWGGWLSSPGVDTGRHAWTAPDTYCVTSQAKDRHAALSEWSDSVRIVIVDSHAPPATPGRPCGPDSTWQGTPVSFMVSTTQAENKDLRYVMDWGDGTRDTTQSSYPSGDTACMNHMWPDSGHYQVKVMVVLNEDPTRASAWSEAATTHVLPNSPPLSPVLNAPLVVGINLPGWFSVTTTDPDGDSIGFQFQWGDGETGAWSDMLIGFLRSGATWQDSHTYTRLDTVLVQCRARDKHKSTSDWCAPETVIVREAGAVRWWWWTDDEDQHIAKTSPVVIIDEEKEYIITTADDGKVYGIGPDGRRKRSGSPVQPDEENVFEAQPAFCAMRQHVVIGNSDGELYAFKPSLAKEWHWPGHTHEDSLTYISWGTAAVNGDKIYAPRENDSLYYFTDLGSDGRFEAAYYISGMVDAPVVDANGYVYIGTDSGYLYKMPPNLSSPTWKKMLRANNDVYSPAIGADGTIYCGTSSGRLYAVNPADGSVRWNVALDGEAYRTVVSPAGLFVATRIGKLYSLNPANSGSMNWVKQCSNNEVLTSPILAGDCVYYQDSADVVFCLRQSDGYLLWSCDCREYGPGGTRCSWRGKPNFFKGQPAILSNGDVVIIGNVMYCVVGYGDKLLMPGAPWPKWQRDEYNTGRVGGL